MVQDLVFPNQLVEQLPSKTLRYEDAHAGPCVALSIPSGSFNEHMVFQGKTSRVPDGWRYNVNPAEGRPYFWNPQLRIVTESFILDERVLNRVAYWGQAIAPFVNKSVKFESDLVLNVSETQEEGTGTCGYYLINYTTRLVFWLRDVSTTSLGLPEVRSATHLKQLLSEQFWIHCEYMPPPHQDFTSDASALVATLGTLFIDAATSTGSVSPFHQDECDSYSKALSRVLKTGRKTEINWCLARIMSLLVQSRIINLYGERYARTDRNMVVSGQYAPHPTAYFQFWSMILLGIPMMYLHRWNAIWVDRVTYTREWGRLTKEITEEYVYALIASGVLIIACVGLLAFTSSSSVRVLTALAVLSAICGAAYSMLLFANFRMLGTCAADAAKFIQEHEHSGTGLQDLALRHGIPWALAIWSAVLMSLSIALVVLQDTVGGLQVHMQHLIFPTMLVGIHLYGRGGFSITRFYSGPPGR